ncbi:MAG: hypothetical protein AUK63_824 [bacterium P3]|nr:MAG: hypothetical protein AUK63_824 [bacterium P3]KWW41450.1 MAG: hypothetical protein F083_1012 [bacterium F083]
MKNIFSRLLLLAILVSSVPNVAVARECTTCKKNQAKRSALQTKAAVCKRAQSTAELNVNNVRALINAYGNMWFDGSVARYYVPAGGNTSPLYCAALWIGGTDVNDQLRIAALRFGSDGDDYWPGPLELNTAYVDLAMCNKYDKHFIITQNEVRDFCSMFDYTGNTPVQKDDFDESRVAQVIKDWPAHDDENQFVSSYLAPFFDADGDGVYDWRKGDYPYYDFDNELCPRTWKAAHPGSSLQMAETMETTDGIVSGGILSDQVLKGDQTIWWVFNDMGNVHTESGGQPIGLEIRAQAFAFSTNDAINNMTFYSYEIINRSTYTLKDTYFSQWVDPDLGYAGDDYVGCDVRRGLGYCYNGDESDGPGSATYSGIPPAVGIDFFQGPYMDPDGLDNPKIDIDKMRLYYSAVLDDYKQLDSNGTYVGNDRYGRTVYDTFALTQDADRFLNAWYFKKDDAVGNCAINGVNFGNGIIDDERFGMRRFVYYNNSSSGENGEPSKATDYYNYLRGRWRNGQRMWFGGDGLNESQGAIRDLECDFMFPGDSDPWNWGTNGVDPWAAGYTKEYWSEANEGNQPSDRRFMQSAGPFTLRPGAVNYITVGIPFAQASSGNAWSSVELLREIDDVCQALFDNCFKVLDGPDAPTLVVREMSNEVMLYITYDNPASNNYGEKYAEIDPSIPRQYTVLEGIERYPGDTTYTHGDTTFTVQTQLNKTYYYDSVDRQYRFEGYQIYQLKDASVSIADIADETKAQLVAQCDIENYYDEERTLPIATLVNYEKGAGTIMVNGGNQGIRHVFRVTNDKFATGTNTALVNNKEYYFICVAYAHNRFKEYVQDDPTKLDGQKTPYLAGRRDENGGTITPVKAIPHDPISENGGTRVNAEFGISPVITRLEGYGTGGNQLQLLASSIEELMGAEGQPAMAPGEFVNGVMQHPAVIPHPQYAENYGPLSIRVIDPLRLKQGRFVINFEGADSASRWFITNADPTQPVYGDTYRVNSDFVIGRYNEQLFLDLGIAVSIQNPEAMATALECTSNNTKYFYGGFVNESGVVVNSSMNHANSYTQWLSGIPDNDGSSMAFNWIRSGSQYSKGYVTAFTSSNSEVSLTETYLDADYYREYYPKLGTATSNSDYKDRAIDRTNVYESVVGGLWAPYGLVSTMDFHPGFNFTYYMADADRIDSLRQKGLIKSTSTVNAIKRSLMNNQLNTALQFNNLAALPSVRIVFTADTSKWTRCPVLEMCDDRTQSEGNARKFHKRIHKSVNKLGQTVDDLGIAADVNDPNNPAYIDEMGMGWFPGYAISVATGERLNIMFGEDSRYVQYNGRDMMWNPVQTYMEGSSNYILGGRHFIYVMNATTQNFFNLSAYSTTPTFQNYTTPSYDAGRWANQMLGSLDRLMNTVQTGVQFVTLYKGIVGGFDGLPQVYPVRDSVAMLFSSVAWVNMPLVSDDYAFKYPGRDATLNAGYASNGIPCDVTVDIHMKMPYGRYMGPNATSASVVTGETAINNDYPRYLFEIGADLAVETGIGLSSDPSDKDNPRWNMQQEILDKIGVAPNPYYSFSEYETANQLDTKVRFSNVPANTVISIYTVDGTLVRRLGPTTGTSTDVASGVSTVVDWDLHNHNGLPIAGGMYLIHFDVPNIGERVVKWFGTMRPVDLNSYHF